MIAWYSRARSSLSRAMSCSRVGTAAASRPSAACRCDTFVAIVLPPLRDRTAPDHKQHTAYQWPGEETTIVPVAPKGPGRPGGGIMRTGACGTGAPACILAPSATTLPPAETTGADMRSITGGLILAVFLTAT